MLASSSRTGVATQGSARADLCLEALLSTLHQLPPELRSQDSDSRYRWSLAAAETLRQILTTDGLLTLVAAGEERFIRTAREHYAVHAFERSDYQRMFRFLCRHARRLTTHGG